MSAGFLRRLCLVALILAATPVVRAQNSPTAAAPQALSRDADQSPSCDPDLVDVTFTFASLPAGEQTVSLHFRNRGDARCRLQGQVGPSFAVDGHSMNVGTCWLCDLHDAPSPAPDRQPGNQVLLAPGERAALDLHWASDGSSCQWADWVDFFPAWSKKTGYIFIPSEWPMHICSAVKSAGYRAEPNASSTTAVRAGELRFSVVQPIVYSDERATLHVELLGAGNAATGSAGCASLYAVRHVRSSGIRLDPLPVSHSVSRPSYTPEQEREDMERAWPPWKKDRLRKCSIPAGQTAADVDIQAAFLSDVTYLEWRTADENPVFVTTAAHFDVLDADSLAPNWGEPVQGIQAGLSVDRERFNVGERVPVHVRWENVNAAMALAQGECQSPQPALEIQDSQHAVLKTVPVLLMCSGHGWGPVEMKKGKAERSFAQLATTHESAPFSVVGELPGPGVYYLVSVWSPHVFYAAERDGNSRIENPGTAGGLYATARSAPVRVEVVKQAVTP